MDGSIDGIEPPAPRAPQPPDRIQPQGQEPLPLAEEAPPPNLDGVGKSLDLYV